MSIRKDHLRAGAAVSVDHFESRLKGRTFSSFGTATSQTYVGGCIFVDHMSGYIHIGHQLGFSASETIRVKQDFERLCLDHGIMVDRYHADNGVFRANAFVQHIREHNQLIRYCGVNAHHQNGVAERSIRTVSDMARAMLFHASARWKDGTSCQNGNLVLVGVFLLDTALTMLVTFLWSSILGLATSVPSFMWYLMTHSVQFPR